MTTLTTSGSAIYLAGNFASSTITADATQMEALGLLAEGRVIMETQKDWVDSYADVDSDIKKGLSVTTACLWASYVIQADMSGYSQISEAQTQLDFLRDQYLSGLRILTADDINSLRSP